MKFYIYKHIRPDTQEVFYIGKGNTSKNSHVERYKTSSGRNKMWKSIVAKNNGVFIPEIICYCDTEIEVNKLEKQYIKKYGRRNLGLGTLCNLTDGGDGSVGIIVTEETRQKLSIAFSGENHPNFGKKLSKETCFRKSESMKKSDKNLRGKKLPDWWKDKIRETKYGSNNPMYGKTGMLSPRSRKVVDINTGEVYDSVSIAAEKYELKMKTLYNMLSGHRPNKYNLKFA